MNGVMNDIFNVYKQEVDVLDSFNQISKEKAKVIQKNDLKVLNSMIRAEEALLMKLAHLEKKKQKALEIFKYENSIKKNVSQRILKKHLNKDELTQFKELSNKFSQALIEQEGHKLKNTKVIESRIEYLDTVLNVIEKENTKYSDITTMIDKRV